MVLVASSGILDYEAIQEKLGWLRIHVEVAVENSFAQVETPVAWA
jgi:hypothetical protein